MQGNIWWELVNISLTAWPSLAQAEAQGEVPLWHEKGTRPSATVSWTAGPDQVNSIQAWFHHCQTQDAFSSSHAFIKFDKTADPDSVEFKKSAQSRQTIKDKKVGRHLPEDDPGWCCTGDHEGSDLVIHHRWEHGQETQIAAWDIIIGPQREKPGICEQQRRRPTYAPLHSDQRLLNSLNSYLNLLQAKFQFPR